MSANGSGAAVSADELERVLLSTLSPAEAERRAAEAHLSALQASVPALFDASIALIVPPSDAPPRRLEARQAAAILLRPLILRKWSPLSERFEGYALPSSDPSSSSAAPPPPAALALDAKARVRAGLLRALVCAERPLRLAASNALSAIAATDFPDEFPDLLPFLRQCLAQPQQGHHDQSSVDAVHGAMVFLADFVKAELDEAQLMGLAQEILPSLEAILMDEQNHSPHIRARAILLFRQLLEVLYMVREQYPQAARQGVDTLLPRWLGALDALLVPSDAELAALQGSAPSGSAAGSEAACVRAWESLAIRYEALKTLSLASHFASHFKPHLASVLPRALHTLQAHISPLLAVQVQSAPEDGAGAEPPAPPRGFPAEGDAGIASSLPAVCSAAVDLVSSLLTASSSIASGTRTLLQGAMGGAGSASRLASYAQALVALAQMGRDEAEEWASDVQAFVAEQEDADGGAGVEFGGSLRAVAADAAAELLDSSGATAAAALPPVEPVAALVRALELAAQQTQQRSASTAADPDWWKPLEAGLAVLGSCAPSITSLLEDGGSAASAVRAAFDVEPIFAHTVMPYVSPDGVAAGAPFLRGQAFIFASQYSALLPPHFARQFLEEAVAALEAATSAGDEGLVVCVCAVRTIKNLYRQLPDDVTRGFAQRVLARIGPMLHALEGDAVVLLLETVQAVVVKGVRTAEHQQADAGEIPDQVYGEIASVSLACFFKRPNDFTLNDVVQDLLEALAGRVSASVGAVVARAALPQLAQTLDASSTVSQEAVGAGFDASALAAAGTQTIVSVLRGANGAALQEADAAALLLPALTHALLASSSFADDRELLQAVVSALTLLLSKVPAQVLAWHHAESGQTALQVLLGVVAKLLDPSDEAETGGLVLGGLLLSMLRKAPADQLHPQLPQLLQAMVARLATAKTGTLSQSLLIPIAFLMIEACPTVLQLLQDARVHTIDGERRALEVLAVKWAEESSTIQGAWAEKANTIALSKLIESKHPILEQLVVKGDIIPDSSGRIVTRSRAKERPDKFTQVSLGTKVLKLLLETWSNAATGGTDGAADADAEEVDDDDDGWDDEDTGNGAGKGFQLSDMLGFDLDDLEDDQVDDSFTGLTAEELKTDPINQTQLRPFITEFLQRQASSQQAFSFAVALDPPARSLLQQAVSGA